MNQPADRIRLFDFSTIPMRAFHCAWMSFFLCFFGWFGLAPLMATIRDDLGLTKDQVANTALASVAGTIFARLLFGWLCDRIGPRISYGVLLMVGAVPVMAIGLAQSYESFLLIRLAIGTIGASFVITQYHTSKMFAPSCVGTANATAAGWGNLGGGIANMTMPLLLGAAAAVGIAPQLGWRLAMIVPGILLFGAGIAYLLLTKDTPNGNLAELRAKGCAPVQSGGGLLAALRDRRVVALALLYGACFGVELMFNNWAALYFQDRMGLAATTAGLLAGTVGCMNLFARSLGGWLGDRCGRRHGLRGRALLLGAVVFIEGLALIGFAASGSLGAAIPCLLVFGLTVCMACGATYAVVPFIMPGNLGSVAGLVGAGGNVGAVLAGLLFKIDGLSTGHAFMIMGAAVAVLALLALTVAPRQVPVPESGPAVEPAPVTDPELAVAVP